MRRRITGTIVGVLAGALFLTAAVHAAGTGGAASPRTKVTLVAPAAPGGGWDAFAREAQQVMRADNVGTVGNTGRSFGAHLHLEIRPGGGAPVNPLPWLAAHGL